MSKFKGGMLSLAVIFFVLVFGIISYFFVSTFIEHQLKPSVETEFRITLESDDRGTQLLSLLMTGNTMELLGYANVENYTEYVDFSSLENLINRMDIDGKKKLVFGILTLGNSTSTESIIADIPIPGGKIGRVEFFV